MKEKMTIPRKVIALCVAVLMAGGALAAPVVLFRTGSALSASSCSTATAQAAPWNAVCYRSRVPEQLLSAAPFTATDPRRLAASVTGLSLTGIYVARLGSDDPNPGHPLGPLMMVDYVFGAIPTHSSNPQSSNRYVSVWEDGFMVENHPGLSSGNGTQYDQLVFPRWRMEIAVTTNGPRSWMITLARRISLAIRSLLPRRAPPLRLYVRGPGSHLAVGASVSFFVLNNIRAARRAAVFEFVVSGGWSRPKVLSPYEGGACGGDNVPFLSRRDQRRWDLDFGDCPEVGLVLAPTHSGPHSIAIRTYHLAIGADGMPIPSRRHLVAHGGFTWIGTAR